MILICVGFYECKICYFPMWANINDSQFVTMVPRNLIYLAMYDVLPNCACPVMIDFQTAILTNICCSYSVCELYSRHVRRFYRPVLNAHLNEGGDL